MITTTSLMKTNTATFRFYEELNDFLPPVKRKITFVYHFNDNPSIKDAIEALGIPHAEVDLILVNNKSKKFSYQLKDQDKVSVYPVFESLNIAGVTRVRKQPLRSVKFILDVHLGKLARYLRLLGFDTEYHNNYSDAEIVRQAKRQRRVILTRDVGLLKNRKVTRGYWLRATQPRQQIIEIIKRFDLANNIAPFTRCLECNGKITTISYKIAVEKLPLKARKYYRKFFQCRQCKKIYWQGSHFKKLQKFVHALIKNGRH